MASSADKMLLSCTQHLIPMQHCKHVFVFSISKSFRFALISIHSKLWWNSTICVHAACSWLPYERLIHTLPLILWVYCLFTCIIRTVMLLCKYRINSLLTVTTPSSVKNDSIVHLQRGPYTTQIITTGGWTDKLPSEECHVEYFKTLIYPSASFSSFHEKRIYGIQLYLCHSIIC